MTAPQVDITAPKREQAEEKFLGTLVGVFTNPVPTLSGVVRRRPIANAFIVIIVVSIAEGLVQAAWLDPAAEGNAWITILSAPAYGIGLTALFTGFYWLMSRMLGGRGGYGAMFAGIGFASAPSILQSLRGFLAILLGDLVGAVAIIGFLQIGVVAWTIIPIRDSRSRVQPVLHRTRVRGSAYTHRCLHSLVRGTPGGRVCNCHHASTMMRLSSVCAAANQAQPLDPVRLTSTRNRVP